MGSDENSEALLIGLSQCPHNMPENWEPQVPAFSADLGKTARSVVQYIGIQRPSSQSLAELNALVQKLEPSCFDRAMFRDRAGHLNYVLIVYFSSSPDHVQWEDASGFTHWWEAQGHIDSDYGLWVERYSFEPGQFETLFSTPDSPEGVARNSTNMIGPIREHGYWGGAEDRIPNSGPQRLQSQFDQMPSVKTSDTLGRRIVVQGPTNVCLIRSGQDLTEMGMRERQIYDAEIEPALSEGLRFLSKNADTGCFDSRYMTHCDESGQPISKTFGMQVFLSIHHLMEWARSHPTHLKIFNKFQNMAMTLKGEIDIRLWHEVAVMDEGNCYAEYVNCDPQTGFLPFLQALKHEEINHD